jgi:hypothetical protein
LTGHVRNLQGVVFVTPRHWCFDVGSGSPSVNGFNKVATNSDGSVDLCFGPTKPANAPDSNFIQPVGDRILEGSWRPPVIRKV